MAAPDHAERLSALDAAFLGIESATSHHQVGALLTFERPPGDPMTLAGLRAYLDRALDQAPRYRQRLVATPLLGHPVWIDDAGFDLARHVQARTVAAPGGPAELEAEAGRLLTDRLDLTAPPWQAWLLDGLAGGGFAVLVKFHHTMLDGIAGANLLLALFAGTDRVAPTEPSRWRPRPAPGRRQLLAAELRHRARACRVQLTRLRAAAAEPAALLAHARGVVAVLNHGLAPASPSPLNPRRIGSRRAFATLSLPLAQVKRIKRALGGTVNDAVLAIAAGALHRYLERHAIDPRTLGDFRVMIPVNLRQGDATGAVDNRVGLLLASLPVGLADPAARYQAVRAELDRLKRDPAQVAASELIEEVADAVAPGLLTLSWRLAIARRAYNVVLTNVPGPPFPLFLAGARLAAIHPVVNLYRNQALGFALMSYTDRLCWGILADAERVPDLAALVRDVEASAAELDELAARRA